MTPSLYIPPFPAIPHSDEVMDAINKVMEAAVADREVSIYVGLSELAQEGCMGADRLLLWAWTR